MEKKKLTEEEVNKITGGRGVSWGDECQVCHAGHYEAVDSNEECCTIVFKCTNCGDTKIWAPGM